MTAASADVSAASADVSAASADVSAASADVAVVGAGIAGLACATELVRLGRDVVVLEAAPRAGGAIETRRIGDYMVERGPSTVRSTPELEALAACAGVALVEGRPGAPLIVVDGKLVSVSAGALARGALLPWRALLAALAEPLRRHPPGSRSVEAFVRERFGREVAARLADVLTLGSFGLPAARVGFEAAFPALAAELDRHRSLTRRFAAGLRQRRRAPRTRLISTSEGLAALPLALASKLGSRLWLDSALESLRRAPAGFALRAGGVELHARHVVLAIPPAGAATLVDDDVASALLREYESTPQTLASFALEEPGSAARWRGFGFLAPSRERLPLLGTLFTSALFPDRAPAGALLLSVFCGPALRDHSDAGIAKELAPLLRRLLGSMREPVLVDVARHPLGIPRYDPHHPERTRRLRTRLAELGGPLVAGCGYDGIGVGAAAASGLAAARTIAGH